MWRRAAIDQLNGPNHSTIRAQLRAVDVVINTRELTGISSVSVRLVISLDALNLSAADIFWMKFVEYLVFNAFFGSIEQDKVGDKICEKDITCIKIERSAGHSAIYF